MAVRNLWVLLLGFCWLSGDTLTLRNGKVIQGTYMGGTARQVRMAVGDRIETYEVSEVASLQFEAPQAERSVQRSGPAAEQSSPAAEGEEIPAGTAIVVRMIESVDSEVHKPGQTFRASVDEPVVVGDKTLIPAGADAVAKLVEVRDPNRLTGGGYLTLELESVTINGKKVAVPAGEIKQAGQSRTGQSAKVIGGAGALGAIIGAIAGGGRGAAVGAATGAGAGTAVQVLTSGPRVRIPSETRLRFTLQQSVRL